MFLGLLSAEEKIIFSKLAIVVIHADGKLEESEQSFLKEYAGEMGISIPNLNEEINSTELVKAISTNSSDLVKRIFLIELMALAKVDGEFAESERALIMSFADMFCISDKVFVECEKLLNEYREISEKMFSFIHQE